MRDAIRPCTCVGLTAASLGAHPAAALVTHVNAVHASPSGTYDGRAPLQYLNQYNVAEVPARGGSTSELDQEIRRCLSTIEKAPPDEKVQMAQHFSCDCGARHGARALVLRLPPSSRAATRLCAACRPAHEHLPASARQTSAARARPRPHRTRAAGRGTRLRDLHEPRVHRRIPAGVSSACKVDPASASSPTVTRPHTTAATCVRAARVAPRASRASRSGAGGGCQD